MSPLGKILFYVAVFGAFVALVFGVLIVDQRGKDAVKLNAAQSARDLAVQKQKAEEATNAALTQAKTQSDKDLADAKASVSDLTDKLTASQKLASDAATALQTATDATKKAQDQLDAIDKALGGKKAEDVVAAEAKAESDLANAESEQKILKDNVDDLKDQVAKGIDALNRSQHGGKMPGVSGKITFVDHAWNFVIVDVGMNSGVVPNGELIVYRNRTFLGKVRVTKVDSNDAVAEILPDVKGDIQIGDAVLN